MWSHVDKSQFLDFWIKIGVDSVDDYSKLTWGKNGRKGVYLCINIWEDDCDIVPWPKDYYFDSLHDIMVISDVYYSGRQKEAVELAKTLGHPWGTVMLDLNTYKVVKMKRSC